MLYTTETLLNQAIEVLTRAKGYARRDSEELMRAPDNRRPRHNADCISWVLDLNDDLNWMIGRCAVFWKRGSVKGLQDYADGIGMKAGDVELRANTFVRFNDVRSQYPNLRWQHFAAAVEWDDPEGRECLQWANEMLATVAEMKAWRRAQRDEDLSIVDPPTNEGAIG